MKKLFTIFCTNSCVHVQAQFVNQLVFKRSFTVHEADSVLTAATGISGVFPLTYPVKVYKIIYNRVNGDSVATTASGLCTLMKQPKVFIFYI